ncbi:DNA polymerase III subunit delta [Lacticaseibacillus nasuensis]|uniref:DNA polymerase III subunit delta n=1 Tax=Lacticaseibacillus nasuensis JCM 17158 TaxID=1291734 RepID=A0A0R1JSW7_9LACO|nr:DNA polymerase III subunit delta [Lacticaseibacillus nasuensis]KRK74421.1 DNA polymerase III, delta subunit [Lacticaseibacillus nasuensis JCM 17158]
MQVGELINQLKAKRIPPLVLLLGEETALRDQALAALTALISEDQATMNLARYDMRETAVSVALDDAQSPPFFGDYREVIIESPYFLSGETGGKVEHDLDSLTAYFKNPVPSTVMVIVAPYKKLDERKRLTKALKKSAVVVDTATLDEPAAKRAITTSLRQAGVTITPGGLNTLTRRTNANYTAMLAAVPKLKLYAANGAELDEAAVSALVPRELTDRVFDLVSAVLAKNTAEALSIYRDLLLQKEEPIRLNNLLENQFQLLLQVKVLMQKGYAQGPLAQTLKVHPYRVKLAIQSARHLALGSLASAYLGLVDTETQMKTGQIDKNLAFELFVLRYAGQA